MGQLQLSASGTNRGKNPRSLILNVANLFLYAALLISSWQVVLYFGSYYYSSYQENLSQQFNMTQYTFQLGQLLESTKSSVMEEFDASRNITTNLANELETLQESVTNWDEMLHQQHERLDQEMARYKAALDETMRRNQESLEANMNSVLNRLDALENSGTTLESTVSDHKSRFAEMWSQVVDRFQSLEGKSSSLEAASTELRQRLSAHDPAQFLPLKDLSKWRQSEQTGVHGIMSQIVGRGMAQGPPELFYFPSNLTAGKVLCLKGNHTSNGTRNSYAFAYKDNLPNGALLLPGTTLVADTYWDYNNPWHSMYNLIQFVYWKMSPGCRSAQRLVLYHWGELRADIGYWIRNIFDAASLPTQPETLSYQGRPVCFEEAVVSRIGIGGVPAAMLTPIYEQVRCTARRKCGVSDFRTGPSKDRKTRVTLVVRGPQRGFINVQDWEDVLNAQCTSERNCYWAKMFVSNLTFCDQVEIMSKTDILVSVHGAQMTNMVFMSPGGRIVEMFPRGWLEFAGHGQFIYKHLAEWVGLNHDGYWRDLNAPVCPEPSNSERCFSFYKDQPVGINSTHISKWVAGVIDSFNFVQAQGLLPVEQRQDKVYKFKWDNATCACPI